jgi:glycosyltransferase involved in cell wall biosynthesis
MDVYQYDFVESGVLAYRKEFSNKPHDIIIASNPPPAALLLAQKLNKLFNIPWVADFRDSYMATEDSNMIKSLKTKTLNRVLKSASGILFVSEGMKSQNIDVFTKFNKTIPSDIIYNGFDLNESILEEDCIERFIEIKRNHDTTLVYTGSLYPERNLDFFLNGLKKIKDPKIALVLVGIQNDFKKEIEKSFPDINVVFFNKVTYSTAIKIQNLADFLLLTMWKGGYTGFSGKVFEYLYSENNIILDYEAPEDLKKYLQDFKNIHYCDESYVEFEKVVKGMKTKEKSSFDLSEKLSRKYQVEKLNTFLKQFEK